MNVASPAPDVDRLLRRVDLARLISDYRPVSKSGPHLFAPCWLHDGPSDHTVSIQRVDRNPGVFVCRTCQRVGNAITFLETGAHMTHDQAVAELTRRVDNESLRAVEQVRPEALDPDVQARIVGQFLSLAIELAPHAAMCGAAYLRARGFAPDVVASHGPFLRLSAPDLARIGSAVPAGPDAESWVRAGLLHRFPDGTTKLVWWDDVTLGVSRRRDGVPMFLWARRHAQGPAVRTSYLFQGQSGGATWAPYNLPALRHAVHQHAPLRVVQTPLAALASVSLGGGKAAPAIALLTRIGWDTAPAAAMRGFWEAIIPDLRRLPAVELVLDRRDDALAADRAHRQAENAAVWLRGRGVAAAVVPLASYGIAGHAMSDAITPVPSAPDATRAPAVPIPVPAATPLSVVVAVCTQPIPFAGPLPTPAVVSAPRVAMPQPVVPVPGPACLLAAVPASTPSAAPADTQAELPMWMLNEVNRVPDTRLALELGLIGGIIEHPDSRQRVCELLGPEPLRCFEDLRCRAVFSILGDALANPPADASMRYAAVMDALHLRDDRSSQEALILVPKAMDHASGSEELLWTARILQRNAKSLR